MDIRVGFISSKTAGEKYRVNFPALRIVSDELIAIESDIVYKVNDQVLVVYTDEGDGFIIGRI